MCVYIYMYIHIYRYIDIYIGFETKMQKVKKKKKNTLNRMVCSDLLESGLFSTCVIKN